MINDGLLTSVILSYLMFSNKTADRSIRSVLNTTGDIEFTRWSTDGGLLFRKEINPSPFVRVCVVRFPLRMSRYGRKERCKDVASPQSFVRTTIGF